MLEKIPWPSEFAIDHAQRVVKLQHTPTGLMTSLYASNAFQKIVDQCIDENIFPTLNGQHSEHFPVLGAEFDMWIERFAAPLFGIINCGAHLTVYTQTSQGMKIWVPRRSANVFTYPNMLDTTVAGGVAAGESPFENAIREADEEASLPEDLVRAQTKACGCLTYIQQSNGTTGDEPGVITPDIVYVFDLQIGPDLVPKPQDGEVKEFYLLSPEEITDRLSRGEFKTNSAVVMVDFFIRHGIITPDNERDYVEIITRMHRQLPFPTTPEK